MKDGRWRPEIIAIATQLRLKPDETSSDWLKRARNVLNTNLVGNSTINQRLKDTSKLGDALIRFPDRSPPARTIHAVKGLEFPAACVVMTTATAGRILDHLEGVASVGGEEDAREIYVAASRAERLLAIAVPKSQTLRLQKLLIGGGSSVKLHQL